MDNTSKKWGQLGSPVKIMQCFSTTGGVARPLPDANECGDAIPECEKVFGLPPTIKLSNKNM